ncbi:hypothetical protein CO083_05495, partial [Candidatus Roizmanbacteria bacterium CG_4_9_14_0_8_um_filter_34_12]
NYLIYNVYCVWIPSYEGMTKTDISFCVNYIEEELGDVLFSLIDLANRYNLGLDKIMEDTFKRYQKKLLIATRMT